jgi:predicted nuclease of predicted toxin-antitoxin system
MRFLVDRCAGRRLAAWLRTQNHDVVESPSLGPDPGDLALLKWAVQHRRIVVTLDKHFARLVFVEATPHCGIVRLPDVPALQRILLMAQVLQRHRDKLEAGAIVTVRGEKIRVSKRTGG